MGNHRESSMYQAERRKNEATADRKASLIKDAVRIMLPISHWKSHHEQVENYKIVFKCRLPYANKCHRALKMSTFHHIKLSSRKFARIRSFTTLREREREVPTWQFILKPTGKILRSDAYQVWVWTSRLLPFLNPPQTENKLVRFDPLLLQPLPVALLIQRSTSLG